MSRNFDYAMGRWRGYFTHRTMELANEAKQAAEQGLLEAQEQYSEPPPTDVEPDQPPPEQQTPGWWENLPDVIPGGVDMSTAMPWMVVGGGVLLAALIFRPRKEG